LKGVKTDKYADQHRVPEQFSGDSFLDWWSVHDKSNGVFIAFSGNADSDANHIWE
jgi:hypothetical protein